MNDVVNFSIKESMTLGRSLFLADKIEEATQVFASAADADPSHFDAAEQTGFCLAAQKRYTESLSWYDRAAAIALTELNMVTLNKSVALGELGHSEEALHMLNGLLRAQPDHAHALYNRGVIRMQMDDFEGGLKDFNRSLEIDPSTANGDAIFCRGFANLVLGNYRQGFEDFEHRLKDNIKGGPAQGAELRPEHVAQTDRAFAPVFTRTILVLSEMGRGDMIQFGRYLPMLVNLGANVVVVADRGIEHLFRGMWNVTILTPTDILPQADYWCHMMGLAHVFGTDVDTVPPPMPVNLNLKKLEEWRKIIPRDGPLNVGLCWAGSPISRYDEHRTLPLETLRTLTDLAERHPVRFYGLQQTIRESDFEARDNLEIDHIGHLFTDFSETAHALHCLDLVITVDTSVAHMAGTVNVPTWVMLTQFRTYWLWIKGMKTTPWYPSFTLFRQEKHGEWEPVLAEIRERLISLTD